MNRVESYDCVECYDCGATLTIVLPRLDQPELWPTCCGTGMFLKDIPGEAGQNQPVAPVAAPGEATPPGANKISLSSLLG